MAGPQQCSTCSRNGGGLPATCFQDFQPSRIRRHGSPITKEDVQEIEQAVGILKALDVPSNKAQAAGSTLKKIGERLETYIDAFLLEAAKSAGKEFGKRLAQLPFWLALYYTLENIGKFVASLFASA